MALDALKELGTQKGMEIETDEQKLTRERKEKNVKTLGVTEARKEVLKLRKENKTLTEERDALLEKTQMAGAVQVPPEMWGTIPAMAYDFLAMRYGEHWRLNEAEMMVYGQSVQAVAERYLPDYAGNHPELVILGVVAITITFNKAKESIKIRLQGEGKKEKGKKEKGEKDAEKQDD